MTRKMTVTMTINNDNFNNNDNDNGSKKNYVCHRDNINGEEILPNSIVNHITQADSMMKKVLLK